MSTTLEVPTGDGEWSRRLVVPIVAGVTICSCALWGLCFGVAELEFKHSLWVNAATVLCALVWIRY